MPRATKKYSFPLVTIAICTLNKVGAVDLCQQLLADAAMDCDVEVLIVNNGPNESLKPQLTKSPHVSYIYDPIAGLSRARNAAALSAKGRYVLFLDDDIILTTKYLANVKRTLLDFEPDILGGPIDPVFDNEPPLWLPHTYITREKTKNSGWAPTGTISGGNFAIQKEIFDQVGGFRCDLGMSGSALGFLEEYEFVLRYRMYPGRKSAGIYYSHECRLGHASPIDKMTLSYLSSRAFKSHRQKGQLFATLAQGRRRRAFRLSASMGGAWSTIADILMTPKRILQQGICKTFVKFAIDLSGRLGLFVGSVFNKPSANRHRPPQSKRHLKVAIGKHMAALNEETFPETITVSNYGHKTLLDLANEVDFWSYEKIAFDQRPPLRTLVRMGQDYPSLTLYAPINGPFGKMLAFCGFINRPVRS